jgi:hypothetical protein
LERKYELPEQISDPLSGLRAYRVGLLKKAIKERADSRLVTHERWAASLDLLLAVVPHTKRLEEMQSEVRYDRRARPSRLSLWQAARDYMSLLRQR